MGRLEESTGWQRSRVQGMFERMALDGDAYQEWFERTWKDREEAIWARYGPSHPPGSPEGYVSALPDRIRRERPGACVCVFPPSADSGHGRVARTSWTYATHGLTQPPDDDCPAPGAWELALELPGAASWAPRLLQLLVEEVIEGVEYGWGHRVAFFLHERADGIVPYLGTPDQHEGIAPLGELRWLLLWPHLRPWGRIPCETGDTGLLVGTGLTEAEFQLLDDVNRSGHHLQLLLCERGVQQLTDPSRRSLVPGKDGERAWERIRRLTPENAYAELMTRFTVQHLDDDWPFEDPPNVAVFTLRSVIHGGADIVRVTHDEEDGAWQFLDRDGARMEEAMVVGLGGMLRRDPTIAELAHLPTGWAATRERAGAPWSWSRKPSEGDKA